MRIRGVAAVLGCLALIQAAAAQPRDVRVSVEPIVEGIMSNVGTIPIAVTIENNGAPLRGQIDFVSNYGGVAAPYQTDAFEIAPNTTKQFIYYRTSDKTFSNFRFVTNRGIFTKNIPEQQTGTGALGMLVVGDEIGAMAYLQLQGATKNRAFVDLTYVKAHPALDRATAFTGWDAVFLADGAERLSDAAVQSLREYMLGGGLVVIHGSADSTLLNDARLRSLSPYSQSRLERHTGAIWPSSPSHPDLVEKGFQVVKGTLRADAITYGPEGDSLAAIRPYGFGSVVYLGVNVVDGPLSAWPKRAQWLGSLISKNSGRLRGRGNLPSSAKPKTQTSNPTSDAKDPFAATLPSVQWALVRLITFFVLVLPINFLILRKLKRLELAWITAPLLSVGFAGLFLFQARGLYASDTATAASTVLVEQAGAPGVLASTSAEVFFRNEGRYDLGFENVILPQRTQDSESGYGYYNRPETGMTVTDVGGYEVPDFQARNLAFETFEVLYRMPDQRFLRVDRFERKGDLVTVSVTNVGEKTLRSLRASGRMGWPPKNTDPELRPGESATLVINVKFKLPESGEGQAATREGFTRIFVICDVDGIRPSPLVGSLITSRSTTQLYSCVGMVREGAQ